MPLKPQKSKIINPRNYLSRCKKIDDVLDPIQKLDVQIPKYNLDLDSKKKAVQRIKSYELLAKHTTNKLESKVKLTNIQEVTMSLSQVLQ